MLQGTGAGRRCKQSKRSAEDKVAKTSAERRQGRETGSDEQEDAGDDKVKPVGSAAGPEKQSRNRPASLPGRPVTDSGGMVLMQSGATADSCSGSKKLDNISAGTSNLRSEASLNLTVKVQSSSNSVMF